MAKSAKKFKDCDAEFNTLFSRIKSRQFAPIYLLAGEEPYFIDVLTDVFSAKIFNAGSTSCYLI